MCVQFLPRTGVPIRERVSGHTSEMSIESSLASVWDTKFLCNRALVWAAGTRLVVLYVSKIPLKLNNNQNITTYQQWMLGKQGWRSGVSARLALMWPGVIPAWCHNYVGWVFWFLPCSEGFSFFFFVWWQKATFFCNFFSWSAKFLSINFSLESISLIRLFG